MACGRSPMASWMNAICASPTRRRPSATSFDNCDNSLPSLIDLAVERHESNRLARQEVEARVAGKAESPLVGGPRVGDAPRSASMRERQEIRARRAWLELQRVSNRTERALIVARVVEHHRASSMPRSPTSAPVRRRWWPRRSSRRRGRAAARKRANCDRARAKLVLRAIARLYSVSAPAQSQS